MSGHPIEDLDDFVYMRDLVPRIVQRITARTDVELVAAFNPLGWFVYMLLGPDDGVLYVGQSVSVTTRIGQHLTPAKRHKVDRVLIFRCANRHRMAQVERALIDEFQPPWNKTFTNRSRPERTAASEHLTRLLEALPDE